MLLYFYNFLPHFALVKVWILSEFFEGGGLLAVNCDMLIMLWHLITVIAKVSIKRESIKWESLRWLHVLSWWPVFHICTSRGGATELCKPPEVGAKRIPQVYFWKIRLSPLEENILYDCQSVISTLSLWFKLNFFNQSRCESCFGTLKSPWKYHGSVNTDNSNHQTPNQTRY